MKSLEGLLGIELPIIQAPMAGVQGSALVIAVSEAGALGSLPTALLGLDAMRQELRAIVSATNKSYNVNFFCHQVPVQDAEREARWRDILRPYYEEFGIDASTIPEGSKRMPFSHDAVSILEEFKPAVVSFHFGLPSPELLERVRGFGAKILSSATTVAEACWLEERGVDAIIAQGVEAGGHRGIFLADDLNTQVGTMALVPQIVRAVQCPVIAAGGIATAEGVAAAFALGAVGVQVGTAYLLCPEATTSTVHRGSLKSEAARTTALTNIFTGRPARGIVNRFMREVGAMNSAAPPFPLASAAVAPIRARAERMGSGDFSPLWAGANTTGCREVPASEITRGLARGLPGNSAHRNDR